jgi:hypothetical protein
LEDVVYLINIPYKKCLSVGVTDAIDKMCITVNESETLTLFKMGIITKDTLKYVSKNKIIQKLLNNKKLYYSDDIIMKIIKDANIKYDIELLIEACKGGRGKLVSLIFNNSDVIPNLECFNSIFKRKSYQHLKVDILLLLVKRLESKGIINIYSYFNSNLEVLRYLCKQVSNSPQKQVEVIDAYIKKEGVIPDIKCLENAFSIRDNILIQYLIETYNIEPNRNCLMLLCCPDNKKGQSPFLKSLDSFCDKLCIPMREDETFDLTDQMREIKDLKGMKDFLSKNKIEPDIICLRNCCCNNDELFKYLIDNFNINIDYICSDKLLQCRKNELFIYCIQKLFQRHT